MVYLVTWDLNREKPNYTQARREFIAHLEQFEHKKDPGLDSVWFISTSRSEDAVDEFLRRKLDTNDRLIVTRLVTGQYQGWLSKATWEWIDPRV